jgi:hypothetical protein
VGGRCVDEPHSYSLVMLPAPAAAAAGAYTSRPPPVVVTFGTRRHAWVRYSVPASASSSAQDSRSAAAAAAAAVAMPTVVAYFSSGRPGASHDSPPPPPTPLQPDGHMLLSFTLVNAAPTRTGHLYSWRFGGEGIVGG